MIYGRTSDYVKEAKNSIGILINRKSAYSVNGNIYLDTSKFKTYVFFHICPKKNYQPRYMTYILINQALQIFFCGTPAIIME